jgi:hypothetical protein
MFRHCRCCGGYARRAMARPDRCARRDTLAFLRNIWYVALWSQDQTFIKAQQDVMPSFGLVSPGFPCVCETRPGLQLIVIEVSPCVG